MTNPEIRSEASELDLTLTRFIAAPRALVWRAWTDPRILKEWWCPKPWTTPVAEIDLRPGGRFHTLMRGPGGEEHDMEGCVLDAAHGERVVFSDAVRAGWRPAAEPFMTAIVTLRDREGGTEYSATVLHKSAEDRAKHEQMGFFDGWGAVMGQLSDIARGMAGEGPLGGGRSVTLTRTLNAPRSLVWRAFTDPEHLPQWWGPASFSIRGKSIDVREGGEWRFDMLGDDGSSYVNRVIYLELSPEGRIILETDDDGVGDFKPFHTILDFEDLGDRTRLSMKMVLADPATMVEVMEKYGALEGGESHLDCLERHLEKMRG